jgi:hypothetical protein
MADPTIPCDNSFGGRISLTVGTTNIAPSDGDITIDPTNTTVTGGANGDGSAFYTSKPKLYGAEIKFRNSSGLVWNDLMKQCSVDATIVEEDNSRTHIYTGARITGEPKLNLATGEVTGCKIEGDQYQMLNN